MDVDVDGPTSATHTLQNYCKCLSVSVLALGNMAMYIVKTI